MPTINIGTANYSAIFTRVSRSTAVQSSIEREIALDQSRRRPSHRRDLQTKKIADMPMMRSLAIPKPPTFFEISQQCVGPSIRGSASRPR